MEIPQPQNGRNRQFWLAAGALCVVVLLVVIVRVRLLNMPLERDEGEYAYAGQLMLDGVPPYQLAYNMKMPGTYAAYALIMAVFGQTAHGIHLGFLFVNLGTLALMFFLARRFLNLWGSVVACATYALLSLSPFLLMLAGHATHLVTLAALGGLLMLLRARQSGRTATLVWSGLLFGVSFLCKQPGLFFGMFGVALLLRDEMQSRPIQWRRCARHVGLFSAAMALPLALTCLLIWRAGTFDRFWFWTIVYARDHASMMPPGIALKRLVSFFNYVGPGWMFLVLAAGGTAFLLSGRNPGDRKFFVIGLAGFSILAFSAGLYFTSHYFIVMLPAVSLLAGIAVTETAQVPVKCIYALAAGLFAVVCSCFAFQYRQVWFQQSPEEASRMIYGSNPFQESAEISGYIKSHAAAGARIAVLGSEPEIYFYSHRHSASGYIYMYDLVEPQPYAQQMQEDLIKDLETVKPQYIIFMKVAITWLPWPNAPTTILNWSQSYLEDYYQLEGAVYMLPGGTEYTWRNDAPASTPLTDHVILIYKRK